MNLPAWTKLVAVVATTVAGATWGANAYLHGTFAEKEPLLVAGAKVDYILMKTEASIVREIALLEREQERRVLTPSELYRLNNLREELKEMRQIRRGK